MQHPLEPSFHPHFAPENISAAVKLYLLLQEAPHCSSFATQECQTLQTLQHADLQQYCKPCGTSASCSCQPYACSTPDPLFGGSDVKIPRKPTENSCEIDFLIDATKEIDLLAFVCCMCRVSSGMQSALDKFLGMMRRKIFIP